MEARIARLEADVAHLRSDVGDVKDEVRTLRDKLDALRDRIDTKFDGVNAALVAVRNSITAAKVWAVLLYIALAAGTFRTMARSFGWIQRGSQAALCCSARSDDRVQYRGPALELVAEAQ